GAVRVDRPGQRGSPAAHLAGRSRVRRREQGAMNRRVLRRVASNVMVGLMIVAVILAVLPLLLILLNLVAKGASSLSWDFFTKMPAPAGESGVGAASLIGIPVGVGAGIYCAEYPGSRLTWLTRFVADVLNGTPSIVVGVFAWT